MRVDRLTSSTSSDTSSDRRRPGRIEQLEDRAIAAAERRRDVRRLDQRGDLVHGQHLRYPLLALRAPHQRCRVIVADAFATQVARETANRGDAPGGRGAAVAAGMQFAEETANRVARDVRRRQRVPGRARRRAEEVEELHQVRLVVADGVLGRIAIEREVVAEGADGVAQRRRGVDVAVGAAPPARRDRAARRGRSRGRPGRQLAHPARRAPAARAAPAPPCAASFLRPPSPRPARERWRAAA